MQLPFHSYRLDTASSARLVNCYAEKAPEGAKGALILRRAPGIPPFTTLSVGPGRGIHVMGGRLYAVSGQKLYHVPLSTPAVELGVVPGTEPVSMANNGVQLSLICRGEGRIYQSGAVTQISDIDFTTRNARVGKFLDNYLLLIAAGTGLFFCSDLADFANYDGLDFATAEGAPDNLIGLEIDHRAAFLLGTDSAELWANSPSGAGFPFQRVPNGFIEQGGAAPLGICKHDNSVLWIANDRTFRRLSGNTGMRVSQHGVEREWRKYARVDDAECHPYTLDGHLCVAVLFPSAGATWIFDITTNEWHERDTYPGVAWDISGIAECYGKVFVQRASTGEIGILDSKTYREWGHTLRAEWAYQPLYGAGKGVQVHRVQMGIEAGVGVASDAQAANPKITLEQSRKGGREGTFRVVASRSLGRQGDFKREVHWDGLGSGKDTVLRASISDPVPLTVWSTEIEAEALAA